MASVPKSFSPAAPEAAPRRARSAARPAERPPEPCELCHGRRWRAGAVAAARRREVRELMAREPAEPRLAFWTCSSCLFLGESPGFSM